MKNIASLVTGMVNSLKESLEDIYGLQLTYLSEEKKAEIVKFVDENLLGVHRDIIERTQRNFGRIDTLKAYRDVAGETQLSTLLKTGFGGNPIYPGLVRQTDDTLAKMYGLGIFKAVPNEHGFGIFESLPENPVQDQVPGKTLELKLTRFGREIGSYINQTNKSQTNITLTGY